MKITTEKGFFIDEVIQKVADFRVAIPCRALDADGTRFDRFSYWGEPASLEKKLDNIGVLHALTKSGGAVSLHIPWDIPDDVKAIKEHTQRLDISFDAMNSNIFQDQPEAKESCKFESLNNVDKKGSKEAEAESDVTKCQKIMQDAYRIVVRPILKAARIKSGAVLNPLQVYREFGARKALIDGSRFKTQVTGL